MPGVWTGLLPDSPHLPYVLAQVPAAVPLAWFPELAKLLAGQHP